MTVPNLPDRRVPLLPVSAQAGIYQPSRMMRTLLALATAIRVGSLTVVLPDGSVRRFVGAEPGPAGTWVVRRDRVARRFLIGGTLGFCEAYLDGDWSSPDIASLFEVTLRNEQALTELLAGRRWFQALQYIGHLLRPNSRRGSRRNIAHHYDLGNRFYETWLDETMTYSSAVFAHPGADEPLSEAQLRKYREIASRLELEPHHHVLEIGCGWGGFAEFAAAQVGARVTAITISREQHVFASRRVQKAGLGDRVEVRLVDYREVSGRYDRVASVEMFEAVGEAYWPVFFCTLRDRLVCGGRAALQVITIADQHFDSYRRGADYIQKYIFPGGMLPSATALRREIVAAGLEWRDATGFGAHYARTLAAWQERFQKAWPDLATMGFDERFKRMWEQYLYYCEAGFKAGSIDVLQVALARA